MSIMRCDNCSRQVDTDEHPESMYVTEEYGYKQQNGNSYGCCCDSCWQNHEQSGY